MSDPAVVLTQRLVAALGEVSADAAGTDPVVRPSDRADFQANGVMGLAKRLGTNPRELAQRVVDAVDLDGIASIEIAGPGFLNLTLDDDFLGRAIGELIGTDDLGLATTEDHQRVVIDYSAPNVAKEMHVGHLRSTVIGDALVRILEARGDTVIRQNHVGDWGTPFGMLIEHLIDLGEQGAIAELALGDLNEFYRQARVSFDGSEAFAGRARARVVALQAGDPETLRLWQILVDLSAEYFQSVYDRLGVRLTTDDLAGESIYNDLLSNVVTDLDEAGLLQTSGGARCVFPEGFTNREGEPLPLIVQKGDGGYGYATTDLAAIRYRIDELKADRILYVVGTTQAEHLAMVFTVAEAAGWLTDATEATHVAFGSVLGEDNKLISCDYPGYFVQSLEATLGAPVALFHGTLGDATPKVPQGEYADDFARAEAYGELLSSIAADTVAGGVEVLPELEFSHVEWVQSVDNLLFKAAAALGILMFDFEVNGLDQKVTTQSTYFRLGAQLQGVAFPGESLTRNGLAIKEAMLAPHKLVLGNTGDALGYFIPGDEWQTGKNNNYEETVSMGKTAGDTARARIIPLIVAGNADL